MKEIAKECNVYGSTDIAADLHDILKGRDPRQIFLLVDKGSAKHCKEALQQLSEISDERTIVIGDGDESKDYTSALEIWQALSNKGATRRAVLINLGGGMPCDLGGFCASTFKRGIDFINIPTTLLSQVDASLGGKTGMNLGRLKNEIGTFRMAKYVIVSPNFLRTLDTQNLLSGYAEMIKHGLIFDSQIVDKLLNFDIRQPDFRLLDEYVCESIRVKRHFVLSDPEEKGIRKALNFGHTFGHAFETEAMRSGRPILHGYAVAYGMVCELLLSSHVLGLDCDKVMQISQKILTLYGAYDTAQTKTDDLIELMTHDKKNDGNGINFTLIDKVGHVVVNQTASKDLICQVLEDFKDLNTKA